MVFPARQIIFGIVAVKNAVIGGMFLKKLK
jgi:hypothetical protein